MEGKGFRIQYDINSYSATKPARWGFPMSAFGVSLVQLWETFARFDTPNSIVLRFGEVCVALHKPRCRYPR